MYNLLTCPAGTDVCDSDTNNWTQANCAACTDADGDGWYVGCDRYSTITGPDNCDGDADNWTATGCSTCVDNDGDGYGAGCDRGCDGDDADASVTDCIPPNTTIDGAPNSFVNVTSATFTFSCDEAACTYECRLDGGGYSGCSSPQSYTGLTDATHTFEVRAIDAVGNTDPTPASVTWTVNQAVGLHWVMIPGGTFQMGDAFSEGDSDERPLHPVTVSTFEMYAYEVTNGEYEACVNAGGCTAPGSNASSYGYGSMAGDDPYRPVNYVSWSQAVDFCSWIGGRLPTEAEWEYAARGGLAGKRFPWGDTIDCSKANYYSVTGYGYDTEGSTGTCVGTTVRVGSYAANGYGLYDMAGNLWELVNDWYSSSYYASSPLTDPQGPASGTSRVLRGGNFGVNFGVNPSGARVADRVSSSPTNLYEVVGFRCAR